MCHSLFTLFQLSVIQARRTMLVAVVSGISLLVNVGLNFAWVPRHGMVGAAYATLVAYALEFTLIAVIAQRVFPLPHGWRLPVISGVVFISALAWTQLYADARPAFGALLAVCAIAGVIWYSLLHTRHLDRLSR